jgi:signal transduction histidine kinase
MPTKTFSLVLGVSKSVDEVLSYWRRTAVIAGLACAICISSIGFAVWLLARQFSTYEALKIAIAERGAAVAAREQAEAHLRHAQKLKAIGQLAGGIAHDFNNLLTVVMCRLESLQRLTQDTNLQRYAENAIEATLRGSALTARLLAFSRRQPLVPQPADCGRLLKSMSDLLCCTLGGNIQVETVVEPNLWRPFIDLNQLDSAILNLALNARDAMQGRGRLTIGATNQVLDENYAQAEPDVTSGEYVLISVSDTGPGIEKDVLERVFEPFFTTKPVGKGTGLGLSQVYGFVKQSGGHIKIESEIGRGTTVKMYLPRAPSDAVAQEGTNSADAEEEPALKQRRRSRD